MIRAMMIIGAVAFLVGLVLYAVIDCIRTDHNHIKVLPKPLWAIIIVLFPVIGALFWLLFGKKKVISSFGPVTLLDTPRAPDDDNDYLRFLEAKSKRVADSRRRQEREAELDRKLDEELKKLRNEEGHKNPGEEAEDS